MFRCSSVPTTKLKDLVASDFIATSSRYLNIVSDIIIDDCHVAPSVSLQEQENKCNTILNELISKAMEVPYFKSVASIVGIGLNLAARIVAEIGDISRFNSRRAISAYAGLNPKIRQSGDIDGTHLAISKKGNRHLRRLLYLGASCNYRLKKHDQLYEFNQKKRQQSNCPLKPKAANIATAHKLLVIIYTLSKNNQEYNS